MTPPRVSLLRKLFLIIQNRSETVGFWTDRDVNKHFTDIEEGNSDNKNMEYQSYHNFVITHFIHVCQVLLVFLSIIDLKVKKQCYYYRYYFNVILTLI